MDRGQTLAVLNQAQALAAFLQNALLDCWREGSDMGDQEKAGFMLSFDLLRNRLDMAARTVQP